eukprot:1143638-Pelagomonas_calceolata.AAC.10
MILNDDDDLKHQIFLDSKEVKSGAFVQTILSDKAQIVVCIAILMGLCVLNRGGDERPRTRAVQHRATHDETRQGFID